MSAAPRPARAGQSDVSAACRERGDEHVGLAPRGPRSARPARGAFKAVEAEGLRAVGARRARRRPRWNAPCWSARDGRISERGGRAWDL